MSHELQHVGVTLADRYRLEREVGRGGMATVYRAEDLKHHRLVAVKVLRSDLAATIGRERFLREVELTAQLDHPHIIPLLDSGEAQSFLYYVMPYVEGESLRDRLLREKQLPVEDALQIVREVADALSYAHSHGVIHRDIKPGNILLSAAHARVADFGIARAIFEAGGDRLTETGLTIGTPTYMSPEQAAGSKDLDGRSDLYSLGCVLFELLAGQPPFTGPTVESIVHQHLAAPPPNITDIRPSVPAPVAAALQRALAKTPADRFSPVALFAEALSWRESTAVPTSGRITRSRVVIAGLVAVLLVGAVLLLGSGLIGRGEWGSPLVIGSALQLTAEDGLETHPAISPDGRLVAYAAGTTTHMRIFIRPLTGGRTISLTEDSSSLETFEIQPRWSPDGSQILYLTREGAFVASALGGASRRIASGLDASRIWAADWGPDGREVFIARTQTVSVMHLDGGSERIIATLPADLHSCSWSPRGDCVACVSGNVNYVMPGPLYGNIAPSAIVVVRTTDGAMKVIAEQTALHQSPVWSPDGSLLYFISDRQGTRDIYAVRVSASGQVRGKQRRVTTGLGAQMIAFSRDGGHLAHVAYAARANVWSVPIPARGPVDALSGQPLTSGGQIIESISVSGDGKWLLYDSNRHGNADIFRVAVEGGPPERLTNNPSDEFAAKLSPDGQEIAFHSWATGSRDIFVQQLDGGAAQQVTRTGSQESFPVWSPDGRALAFLDQSVDDGVTAGLFVTHRDQSGDWSAPRARRTDSGRASWSADGQVLVYTRRGTIETIAPDSGSPRVVYAPRSGSADPVPRLVLVSEDGGTLYFKSHDPNGRGSIWSVPLSGGRPRLLVRFDDLSRPSIRADFAAGAGRFFFTIEERQSDIWVAEVTGR